MNRQLTFMVPEEWVEQLKRIARNISVKQDKTVNYLELIRSALKEKYNLTEPNVNHKN